ncbi:MAG: Ig-like domain-containing protein [Chloroflexota bacterium]
MQPIHANAASAQAFLYEIPGAATLISPAGYLGTNTTPTYTWEEVTTPDTDYLLKVINPAGTAVVDRIYEGGEVCNSGICSITPNVILTGGVHIWAIRTVTNEGWGPWSEIWSISIEPDTTITGNPDLLSASADASFTFTSDDPDASFECSLDAGAFAACLSPQDYTGLADSSHTFEVRAVEGLGGNPDPTPASYTWTVDTTAPDTTITSQPDDPSSSADANFSFTSTEAGSTFECSLDGSAFASCNDPQDYTGLADASHTFQVRATDLAGNTDPTPAAYTWAVNAVNDPPTVSLSNTVTSLAEDADTSAATKVADITIADDGLGTNTLSLSGADAAMFEITGPALYLEAGAALDHETNPVLDVTVEVNDPDVGATPDDSESLAISITDVNEAPVADDQSVSTDEDTALPITLTGSDVDGDPLTFTVVDDPLHGTLTGAAPDLTYTPDANYNGPDSFTFKANDGALDSNTATVSITVNPVNDAPICAPVSLVTDEDTAGQADPSCTDIEGDTLTFSIAAQPAHGSASVALGKLVYTPDADFNGPDSFTYKANDGAADSNAATVSVTVNPVNDAPVADDQSVSTDEDTALPITLTGSDVDGDPLTFTVVDDPLHGTLTGTAPDLTYTPDANYNGPDSFTFKANDGALDSNTATVSITVNPVNDAPVADAQIVSTPQDTPLPITLTGSDVENDPLTFAVATDPAHGTLTGTAPDLIYTPDPGFFGADSFSFTVNDGLLDSAPAVVQINVTHVNSAPTDITLSNASVEENKPVGTLVGTLTSTDPDAGDTFTYSFCGGADDASFTIDVDALKTAEVFDFETKAIYDICVQTDDGNGGTFQEAFTIAVTDGKPVTLTFRSQAAYDGWVRESSETSNKGGALNSTTATFNLGDSLKNQQYRGILSFNTAGLPDNAVITKVLIKIRKQGLVGTDPFTTHQGLKVDIRKWVFSANKILQITDFQAFAHKSAIGTFNKTLANSWYTARLYTTAFPFVNLGGLTQFRLRFAKDDNNDDSADYLKFFSGNAALDDRPQLIVTYYIP